MVCTCDTANTFLIILIGLLNTLMLFVETWLRHWLLWFEFDVYQRYVNFSFHYVTCKPNLSTSSESVSLIAMWISNCQLNYAQHGNHPRQGKAKLRCWKLERQIENSWGRVGSKYGKDGPGMYEGEHLKVEEEKRIMSKALIQNLTDRIIGILAVSSSSPVSSSSLEDVRSIAMHLMSSLLLTC